jgi:hypothetical protein
MGETPMACATRGAMVGTRRGIDAMDWIAGVTTSGAQPLSSTAPGHDPEIRLAVPAMLQGDLQQARRRGAY